MKVPVCEASIGEQELKNVTDCVKSGWISGYKGKYIDEFEQRFAEYCGARYAVTTTSCATAMLLTLETMGIGEGDEVITTDFTMIATVAAIIRAKAKPVLVDVEPDTWCIDPDGIKAKINSRTRAIMPVPIYGHPVDSDRILGIAREHGLLVIEDAAEAIGSEYKGGERVGSLFDATCFSFYINKTITAGCGGMIVTNSKSFADKARRMKSYDTDPESRFIHQNLGFNYRMCLPAKTKVLVEKEAKWKNQTNNGVSKKLIPTPIEAIKTGDKVLSFNEQTGKKEVRNVIGTAIGTDDRLLRLTFSNGNELVLTSNHPVFIHGKGWVEADNVQLGDTTIQYKYLALKWRLSSLAKKGKKLEAILGEERATRIKMNHGTRIKQLRANPQSAYGTSTLFNSLEIRKKQGETLRRVNQERNLYPAERRLKISCVSKRMWADPTSKIRSAESIQRRGDSVSRAIKLRITIDPLFAQSLRERGLYAIKNVGRKPTHLEIELLRLLTENLPDTYKFVGDGKFWIENANPDFINVNGYKKAIEIYSPYWKIRDYGSVAEYQKQRSELFKQYGWEVLFIEAKRKITDKNEVIKKILDFTYNPSSETVTVVAKEVVQGSHTVYNLDVENNNNFYAFGILVHNTNMQAAIGCGQMDRIDEFVAKKRYIAKLYRERLEEIPALTLPVERAGCVNSYWVFGILLPAVIDRDDFIRGLADKDIETRRFFYPMHRQPALIKLGLVTGTERDFPVSDDISRRGLYLPNGVTLTDEQIDYTCNCIERILDG